MAEMFCLFLILYTVYISAITRTKQFLLWDVICRKKLLTARSVQSYGEMVMNIDKKLLREVCSETGASRRAIQGYEKAGLVSASGKNKYGYLLYSQSEIERIGKIRFFQQIGLSVKEIQQTIDAPAEIQKSAMLKRITMLEKQSRDISMLIEKINRYISEL